MQFRWSLVTVLCILASLWIGCAYAVAPVTGFIYSDVKAPLTVTSSTGYSKVGTAECSSLLGWVATGDASIEAAMKNGGITKVHHVDYHSKSVLGVYSVFTLTVYGE